MAAEHRNHADEIEHHRKLSVAFNAGKSAAAAGIDTIACPYRTESEVGKEWFLGYAEGKKCQSN